MREIDLANLELPDGWEGRAQVAIDAGAAQVNSHAAVWQECKKPLKKLSHDKCYYCEIIQERSDDAVDHFRPKSLYPWSAFSADNYRFACTYCNSRRRDVENNRTGGKGDNFPLVDEDRRATCCDEEDNESPILLDPCQSDEPGLIDFDDDGKPVPTYSKEEHEVRNMRAETSIQLYHLHHQDLVDRRLALAAKITRKVRAAERLFPQTEQGDAAIDASFKEHVRSLAELIRPEAELSSFARRMLDGYRGLTWVRGILRTV